MWKGTNKRENPAYQNGKYKSMTAKPLKTFNYMTSFKHQKSKPLSNEEQRPRLVSGCRIQLLSW